MQSFRINDELEVICETKNTRNGFKHVATLLCRGNELESVKVCYLNRTWERYTYETVMQKLQSKAHKDGTIGDNDARDFAEAIKNGGGDDYMQENVTGKKAKSGYARLQKMPSSGY